MTPQAYKIVPINPKTGKEIKRPRQFQEVFLALKGPKGGLKKISVDTQKYFKGDFERLNKTVKKSEGGNVILYNEKTIQIRRDKNGEKLYQTETVIRTVKKKKKKVRQFKLDADGKKTPLYKLKVTTARRSRLQKPVLYIKGKAKRDLDIGFKRGHKRIAVSKERLFLAKPNVVKPIAISVKGPTIKFALEQLQLNAQIKDIKNANSGLYFSIVISIKNPQGEITRIPISDSWFPRPRGKSENNSPIDGFLNDTVSYMPIPGYKRYPAMKQKLQTVSNLHSKIAFSVRRALMTHGYKFTTMATLKQIETRALKQELPLLEQSPSFTEEKRERFMNGLDGLFKFGAYGEYKKLPKQITKKWEVTLFIRFELY